MADIADIGFRADTGDLKDAKASLEALVPAASKVEAATVKVERALNGVGGAAAGAASGSTKAGQAMQAAAAGANADTAATEKLSRATGAASINLNGFAIALDQAAIAGRRVEAANLQAKIGVQNLGTAIMAASAGMRQNAQQLDAHVVAFNRMRAGADGVGKSMKFSAREGLNFSRQFADIGVTAAMGMNPLMIALQQGPQLFDIIQEKAIVSGTTIGSVFKAAGAAIWTALAPLLPLILGIAAVVGVIAAAFALGTREINKGNQSVIDGMGLTEKQLKRVKDAGVDTGVTIGDTFTAFFQVIGDRLLEAFDGPLKWLADAWGTAMDFITKYGSKAIEFIVGGFVGAVYAIKAGWSILPSAVGDVAISVANGVIGVIEGMVNASINGINFLARQANKILPDFMQLGQLDGASFGRLNNPFAGQAAALGDAISGGIRRGLAESEGIVGDFFDDVEARARENARGRIRKAAGDATGGGSRGPKTEAEKFEDIVTGANADIAAQRAREQAAGLTMTAEAAEALEYRTKLLNEAQQKGITLTDAMRTQIDELAGAYARAKIAADNAVFLNDILKGADRGIAAIQQQIDMLGIYGHELARVTELNRLLGEAASKGMTPEAIAAARPQFEEKANQYANASATLASGQFMEEQRRQAQERMIALEQERRMIGMSADETTRLRIENELLADARQKNIDLTPADIAAIQGIAREQATVENSIRKTREALDFAKDATKGFFADMRNGLAQGQSLWEAFGNSVLNVLNKIIDKLLDKTLDAAIDALFSGGQGGGGGASSGNGWVNAAMTIGKALFSANGNAFSQSGLMAFASGGAFTNGVVNKPTAFAYGKGKIGVMGEAGDEAIMPLQRGPDGSLGVQMYGGASGGTQVNAPVTFNQSFNMSGLVTSADAQNMAKDAADKAKQEMKREIVPLLNQYSQDGAVV